MKRPKNWYVSFEAPTPHRVRNARSFETESEAKHFAKEAISSGKLVNAGTLDMHKPRRFIPSNKIAEWLSADSSHQ
jgi:hypothetical protein